MLDDTFYQRLTPFDMGRVSQVCLIEQSRNPQAPSGPELPTGQHPQNSTLSVWPEPLAPSVASDGFQWFTCENSKGTKHSFEKEDSSVSPEAPGLSPPPV